MTIRLVTDDVCDTIDAFERLALLLSHLAHKNIKALGLGLLGGIGFMTLGLI